MKKILIVGIIIVVSVLFAEEGKHDNSEFEHFNNYRNEQNAVNFKVAINHYLQMENDYQSNLMLSYLCFMELEKNLDILGNDIDSLATRTKFSYANLLLELDKLDESIAIYDRLNTDFPKWSCPWRHKGEALLKQQNYPDAELATMKAIEVREDHFDAYIQLAKVQKEMGKYEEALKSLNKGLSYYSSDPEEEVSDEEVKILKAELKSLIIE